MANTGTKYKNQDIRNDNIHAIVNLVSITHCRAIINRARPQNFLQKNCMFEHRRPVFAVRLKTPCILAAQRVTSKDSDQTVLMRWMM